MKKFVIYFVAFLFAIAFLSCNNNNNDTNENSDSTEVVSNNTETEENEVGTFTDNRDEHVYKTVKIGDQIWMAENLAFDAENGCWVYDNDENNVEKYGRLYNWETAKISCPDGWHLPTNEEWIELINYLGGKDIAGKKMKTSTQWKIGSKNYGNNSSGFSALPSGIRNSSFNAFKFKGNFCRWWTATEFTATSAYECDISYDGDRIYNDVKNKLDGASIRCIKDKN